MKKTHLLKPILLHILISIFAGIIFNIIQSFDSLMINYFTRNICYITESIITIFLYFFWGKKFLKGISSKTILTSIGIILSLNLILALSGYLMMNYGSGITVENGQLPIIILINLNYGFSALVYLFNLPELVNILLISFMAPIFLYCGSRESLITK